jgi:hypothetical protein
MKIHHSAVEFPGMKTVIHGDGHLAIDLMGFFRIGGPCSHHISNSAHSFTKE